MTIIKYVGLTAEASALIESRRRRADQTESEIIVDALRLAAEPPSSQAKLDLGQGVELAPGERLILLLNEQSKRAEKPDGWCEVGADGIYVEGRKVENRRPLNAAMRIWQLRAVKHGRLPKVVQLNAWTKWHVKRNGRLLSLFELKDPGLAHKRGATIDVDKLLDEFLAAAPQDVSDGMTGGQ